MSRSQSKVSPSLGVHLNLDASHSTILGSSSIAFLFSHQGLFSTKSAWDKPLFPWQSIAKLHIKTLAMHCQDRFLAHGQIHYQKCSIAGFASPARRDRDEGPDE